MVKEYSNGQELLNENEALLATNQDLAAFFYWDAPLLKETNRINYALRVEMDASSSMESSQASTAQPYLLALKLEPFNLLLFGNPNLATQLVRYLQASNKEIKNYLCSSDVGDAFQKALKDEMQLEYTEALAMDFMESFSITEPSSPQVEVANEKDIDEIFECLQAFVKDCGLLDKVHRENVAKTISDFRIIREDGCIVSLAKAVPSVPGTYKITDVYTRNEYRGKGLARQVVNNIKNEVLSSGARITLNVDKKNPISNRLYEDLGFKRLFSQGEYRRVE